MRVIAGIARGHKLESIEGMKTRPTTDRIKETLFNIIAFELQGCHFLDLFAGSGAIGIEALSRGAQRAVFVDDAADAAAMIEKNLHHTKLHDRADILRLNVIDALKQLAEKGESFDIIFMDPPYGQMLAASVLQALLQYNVLQKDGFVIMEHASDSAFCGVGGFQIIKKKVYKTTTMTFLSLEESVSC